MRIFLNLHEVFQNWSRSLGGVLTRAELLAWRNIALKIGRDVRFLLSVLIVVLTAAVSIYSMAGQVSTLHWAAATVPCLAGFSLYKGLYFAPGSVRRLAVQSGPFHPWTAFATQFERWCRLRAIILTGLCLCLLSLPVAMARPDAALLFFGLGALGAAASVASAFIFKGHRRKA